MASRLCGIVGFFDTDERSEQDALTILRAMMDRVRHRGPDGDGTFVDGRCALGHVRLKIIDLSDAARQPMRSIDSTCAVTFNGEIYNFRALRGELEADGPFRSASDTEVLLRGYQQWGLDVFRRVNGMVAAAIWDRERQRLVLARDRLGKKPLFYAWNGAGRVVFASELKALLVHPSIDATLDEESLAHYFTFGYVPTPRTIFKDIFKVPQGSTVTFERGARIIEPYWQLPEDELRMSEADALDELDSVLRDAVRLRLESDVPLGFFLSGGLDSTLVTAIGRQLADDVRTFTVGFDDPAYDESRHARAIAEHLETRHTEVRIDSRDFANFIAKAPAYYDEPFADSSLIATYYLARATKQHVTVALSGDGGDELFCGYKKYIDLRRALQIPASLRVTTGRALERVPTDKSRKIGQALQAGSLDELVRWLVSVWKPSELARLMPSSQGAWPHSAVAREWQRFQHRDPLSRFMATDIGSYLCDDILQKVDRASMAVALEIRSPLLDYRVVELAMRLPLDLKYRKGKRKYLLRQLLRRYVPAELWDNRRKQGFEVPVRTWYRGERQIDLLLAIEGLHGRFPSLLSIDSMKHVMTHHLTGRYDYSQKLFALDSLHRWMTEYQ